MNSEMLNVKAFIRNIPPIERRRSGWIVARRDDFTSMLWYYGTYDTQERALDVATELDNGVVLNYEKDSHNDI